MKKMKPFTEDDAVVNKPYMVWIPWYNRETLKYELRSAKLKSIEKQNMNDPENTIPYFEYRWEAEKYIKQLNLI